MRQTLVEIKAGWHTFNLNIMHRVLYTIQYIIALFCHQSAHFAFTFLTVPGVNE